MIRSFTAHSVITLPNLSAASASRLLQELLTAAQAEHGAPPWLKTDSEELHGAYGALHAELQLQLAQAAGGEPPPVKTADQAEDSAFSALYFWIDGWARLPVERYPEAAKAAEVKTAIFPTGRGFLALRPADEWQQAELRLNLLADPSKGLGRIVLDLGGQPFLDELRRVHRAYGQALGITAVKAAPESPALRSALDDACEIIRGYVLRVSGSVRAKDPTTAARADRLLAPLIHWRDADHKKPAPTEQPAS